MRDDFLYFPNIQITYFYNVHKHGYYFRMVSVPIIMTIHAPQYKHTIQHILEIQRRIFILTLLIASKEWLKMLFIAV